MLRRRGDTVWAFGPFSRGAGAFLGFGLLALWILWPAVAPNSADRMTIGTAADDFLRQFYPYRAFVAGAWASGHIPFWNPHQYAGTPAWADPQLAVLYPWRLLQIPFAFGERTLPLWSLTLEAIGHLALGGIFTFGLVRTLGAHPTAASLSGVVFASSGYLTGYPLQQLAVLDTAVWIPATLWALTAALDANDPAGRRRAALAAGAATALAVFAGHPQTALYAVLAGVFWVLWRAVAERRSVIEVAVVWLASGAALSAAQWWPTLAFSRVVSRSPSAEELLAGFPLRDVVQLAAPHAVSCFSPLYVGSAALALAGWGAVRSRRARPWIALAAFAWLVSLGGNGPIVPLAFRVLPALAIFRHQERIAVLVALGLAVAAGLALNELIGRSSSRAGAARTAFALSAGAAVVAAMLYIAPVGDALAATCRPEVTPGPLSLALADGLVRTALGSGALALVLGALVAGRLQARAAGMAIVMVAILELVSVNRGRALAPIDPAAGPVFARSSIVEALRQRARDGRVSSESHLPGGPNAASVHGLYDVTGDSPLNFAAFDNLVEEAPEMVWWRLFGVRYVLSRRTIGSAEAGVLSELARDGESVLYEVSLPVPPAWAAPIIVNPLWTPRQDFDPLRCVVLDEVPVVAFELQIPEGSERDSCDPSSVKNPHDVSLTGLDPGRASVTALLADPAAVVLSTAYDPGGGWSARATAATGEVIEPQVVRAYGALPAVVLPAGEWTVEWRYRPRAILFGIIVSAITLVLVLAGTLGAKRWRREPYAQW